MKQFSQNIIHKSISIKRALEVLNTMGGKDSLTLFVINDNEQMVGTLTDGDVRRGLLSGINIADKVEQIMHREFRYLQRNKFGLAEIDKLRNDEINLIPLLDEIGKILKIIPLNEKKCVLPIDAIIMAGGEGKRLHPLTIDTPKPLLNVGNKPIVEHNIDRLEAYGIDNIWISIKYLGSKIENYFKDGSGKGIKVKYVREEEYLGTLGSITLVDDFVHDTILVMNSDLLTDIDYEDFYRSFIASNADMAVAGIPYSINVPYAVLEVQGENIVSLKEKPTYTYYSNGGIYLIKKELIKSIPYNTFFNATDLMEKAVNERLKLVYYPILGYWLDIGKHEDYKKAQEDIKRLKI
jgi:dTDP-glucose pyrophosphorylase